MTPTQCENRNTKGHAKVNNKLLKMLYTLNLPARKIRILLWVIRKTSANQKKEFNLNVWEMSKKLRIEYSNAKRLVRELKKTGILTEHGIKEF